MHICVALPLTNYCEKFIHCHQVFATLIAKKKEKENWLQLELSDTIYLIA